MLKEITLPAQVDAFRFAENAARLQGTLFIKEMQRLGPSLYTKDGEMHVQMEFGIDKQGVRFLRGQFTACLKLQCQRCLGPFDYKAEGNFVSGIIRSEEDAAQLPKGYDPLIANEGMLTLQDIFEDELIVNLPIVPMHSSDDCKVTLPLIIETDEKVEASKDNPFKVIEFLKVRS